MAERLERWAGLAMGVGATLAVLSPLVGATADSFPISNYPMFARPRGQPTLYAAVARTRDGQEQRLPPSAVGSSEVLQTKVLIERSVAQGPEATAALCRSIAERLATSPDAAGLRSVEIVRRRYDPIGYFVNGPEPIEQERLQSCPLPGQRRRDAGGAGRRPRLGGQP